MSPTDSANLQAIADFLPVLQFLLEATSQLVGLIAGFISWRLVILAKNHKDIW
jgi:hypothetical protein